MLNLITQNTALPLTLSSVKESLAIDSTSDDNRLTAMIWAASLFIEKSTNRSFSSNTYELTLDSFPRRIDVPLPPLASITYIKYYDTNNTLQTMNSSDYIVVFGQRSKSTITHIENFPATYNRPDAVTIRFTTAATENTELFKMAVKVLVAHWNENREGQQIPAGFDSILNMLTCWQGVW
ncbi:MAG: head-tail connector protein [Planctomycetaceae bacterium]